MTIQNLVPNFNKCCRTGEQVPLGSGNERKKSEEIKDRGIKESK